MLAALKIVGSSAASIYGDSHQQLVTLRLTLQACAEHEQCQSPQRRTAFRFVDCVPCYRLGGTQYRALRALACSSDPICLIIFLNWRTNLEIPLSKKWCADFYMIDK